MDLLDYHHANALRSIDRPCHSEFRRATTDFVLQVEGVSSLISSIQTRGSSFARFSLPIWNSHKSMSQLATFPS
jgi:hypothetical protein